MGTAARGIKWGENLVTIAARANTYLPAESLLCVGLFLGWLWDVETEGKEDRFLVLSQKARTREKDAIEFLRESGGGGKLCGSRKQTKALSASFRSEGLTLLDHLMSCTGETSVGVESKCDALDRVELWERSNKDKQR